MLKRASLVAILSLAAACTTSFATNNDASDAIEVNASSSSVRSVQTLANSADRVLRHGNAIFYTDFQNVELRSVPVTGGASKVLWKGRTSPMDQLGDIAVDDKDIFFVEDGQILRIPQAGGRWDILIRIHDAGELPGDIDIDDTHVYWTTGTVDHAVIRRVAKTGGAPETIYDGPRGGFGILVKGGFVYFHGTDRSQPDTDTSEYVMKVEAKPNGAVTEIAHIDGSLRDITMAGDEIFFGNKSGEPATWALYGVSKNGGAVRTVVTLGESNDVTPYSLVSNSNTLYWAQSQTFDWHASPPGQHDAKVLSIATTGAATPSEVATKLDGAPIIALFEDECPVWGGRYEISAVDHCR